MIVRRETTIIDYHRPFGQALTVNLFVEAGRLFCLLSSTFMTMRDVDVTIRDVDITMRCVDVTLRDVHVKQHHFLSCVEFSN